MNKQLNSLDSLTFSQSIAYNYNERGWLLSSNAALFQMRLQYNSVNNIAGITPTAQYNGNIASQSWGTSNTPNANSYVYTYDQLNRLTAGTGTTGNSENSITYDLNGNISTLNRYQGASANLIDQLSYTYNNTNQLQNVTDNSGYFGTTDLVSGTTNYTYDNNGNVLNNSNTANTTQNKSYTYNMLNLPVTITKPTGTVTYTYDANGRKLRKVSVISGTTNTTDYIDGIEYDNSTTKIGFIQTEEGKVVPSSAYDYYYYLGDNLGNTRITFDTENGIVTPLQTDDYYPFGLEINSLVNSTKNEYLYNKKELQEELGQYDYGARFYDPVIARFTTIDPLAEHFPWMTSYQYASNNPTSKKDIDGLEGVFFFEEAGVNFEPVTESIAKAGGDVAKAGEEGPKPTESHHVVPRALKGDEFVEEAREGGFKFEGQENKIDLEKYNKSTGEGEHGNHPDYTKGMKDKINDIKEKNPDASPAEKANLLRNTVKDVKDLINNNRGVKTNDLFKPKTAAVDAVKTVGPPKKAPPKKSNKTQTQSFIRYI